MISFLPQSILFNNINSLYLAKKIFFCSINSIEKCFFVYALHTKFVKTKNKATIKIVESVFFKHTWLLVNI